MPELTFLTIAEVERLGDGDGIFAGQLILQIATGDVGIEILNVAVLDVTADSLAASNQDADCGGSEVAVIEVFAHVGEEDRLIADAQEASALNELRGTDASGSDGKKSPRKFSGLRNLDGSLLAKKLASTLSVKKSTFRHSPGCLRLVCQV